MEIDTTNKFGVSASDGQVRVLLAHRLLSPITKDEALNLAAWLVTLSGTSWERFDELFEEVQKT